MVYLKVQSSKERGDAVLGEKKAKQNGRKVKEAKQIYTGTDSFAKYARKQILQTA